MINIIIKEYIKNYISPLSKLINNFEGLQKIYLINFIGSQE